MSLRIDVVTAGIALTAHVGFAFALAQSHPSERPRAPPTEVELWRTPARATPAPARAASVPAAAPPRRRVALRSQRAPQMSPPTPSDAPPTSEPPAFGISMASTTEIPSPVAVRAGGSPSLDPRTGSRAGPAGPPLDVPVSGIDVKDTPGIDVEACGNSVRYPADAERNGVEGDVRLRVSLDERGRVSSVRILAGLGHGLDEAAVEAIQHRCRFTPAIAKDGRKVAYVIQSYTFHFELPR